jgi:hypothetical protein
MPAASTTSYIEASREFYERRHPFYNDLVEHWQFVFSSYKGGRKWFDTNVFRYLKEGDQEYQDRIKRAYRFNHTREVIDLVAKYLFKAKIARRTDDAPDALKAFWENATRSGLNIDQFMKISSTQASMGGRIAVVVDNNMPAVVETASGEARPMSQAEAEEAKIRAYAYTVMPWNVLDYAWDEDGDGELLWIKLREFVRDDSNPHDSSGQYEERIRLWTRTDWTLYAEREVSTATGTRRSTKVVTEKKIIEIDKGEHKLGFVPVKLFDHVIGGEPYEAPGLADDIAYLDRAVANYLSNLDAIIQDQTFSQLAIPAQSLSQAEDQFKKIVEMGTKRIFTYDGGAGSNAKPEFISPDPKQAAIIVSVISKIINEIYHTVGLAGERTKEDNSVGIDNSSGVAKAYDFERVNALLLSKAQSCEHLENWIVKTVLAWNSVTTAPKERVVTYPTTFDVARLSDEIATAKALGEVNAPIEVKRIQMESIVDKLFPNIALTVRDELRAAIKKWGDEPPVPPGTATEATKTVAGSRQGEVTNKTKSASQ